MNILHYSLGFPPFRSGGMTKYCMDLMNEESKLGNEVSLLWPGTYIGNFAFCKILEKKHQFGFSSYCILNPLPVPLLDGIEDISSFTSVRNRNVFLLFLKSKGFDAIHIHTLMGLPKEFLEVAKELNIKTVFTSHDYFGLCPKAGFMRGDELCTDDNCQHCDSCCQTALSLNKIRIIQSPFYRSIKNNKIVSKFRKTHISNLNDLYNANEINATEQGTDVNKYIVLRKYYISLFSLIDVLHFNSNQTREIYSKYLNFNNKDVVVSISNDGVRDNRKMRQLHSPVRVGYLGPVGVRKGFFALKKALDDIYSEKIYQFQLYMHSASKVEGSYIISNPPFTHAELGKVFDEIDVLIVPSLWYETFGFTVLEALSYGVPVVVSEYVGARDLLKNGKYGCVYNQENDGIGKILKAILSDPKVLIELNRNICDSCCIKTMKEHTMEMIDIYKIS